MYASTPKVFYFPSKEFFYMEVAHANGRTTQNIEGSIKDQRQLPRSKVKKYEIEFKTKAGLKFTKLNAQVPILAIKLIYFVNGQHCIKNCLLVLPTTLDWNGC